MHRPRALSRTMAPVGVSGHCICIDFLHTALFSNLTDTPLSNNRPDTVGELKSAEICVSHMPSLKAKKLRKLPQEKVLLELRNRFANSNVPYTETGDCSPSSDVQTDLC